MQSGLLKGQRRSGLSKIRLQELAQQIALVAAGVLALLGLAAWTVSGNSLAWVRLTTSSAAAGLACAAGLGLSFRSNERGRQTLMRLLACVALLPVLASIMTAISGRAGASSIAVPEPPILAGVAFLFLGAILWFLDSRGGPAAAIADTSVLGLGWSILTLLAEYLFRAMHVFQLEQPTAVSAALLWMLTLLSVTAAARRLDNGMFVVFVGDGLSARITRTLLPFVMILPFLREVLRARLIASGRVPEHAATAAMASTAAIVSACVVLVIGYYFRRMENEIRELSLRDELTGLYNLRGFHLLADQAFRLAQRSQLPFSVMYVDVDDLKLINDEMGHAAGSLLLVETAELLRSKFRETDVVGRIGGDEFAVAGQFDPEAIAEAAERLVEAAGNTGKRLHPSLSIGYVSADLHRHESLKDLLALADAAMYDQKRRKKQSQMAI